MQASFILSSARSGSTLTRFVVDTHPDTYSPGKLRLGELSRLFYWCEKTPDNLSYLDLLKTTFTNALKTVEDGKIRIRGAFSEQSMRGLMPLLRTDLKRPPGLPA